MAGTDIEIKATMLNMMMMFRLGKCGDVDTVVYIMSNEYYSLLYNNCIMVSILY